MCAEEEKVKAAVSADASLAVLAEEDLSRIEGEKEELKKQIKMDIENTRQAMNTDA